MPRPPKDVTDAELALLHVLWDGSGKTARDVMAAVYPNGTESDYATVKKLLSRLEKKGFVTRDRGQPAHAFAAAVTRDELLGRRLQGLADSLCGGSSAPLLMQLLGGQTVNDEQRDRLRALIEELAPPTEDQQ